MDTPQLVICGSIAIDRIMNFSGRYQDVIKPDKLHVLSLSVLLDKLENSPGGIGANIAYGIAQLGDEPILLGSVGADATDYMERLAKLGVDTSQLHHSKLPTASFNVITDNDGSQVGGFYQGAMSDSDSVSFTSWAGKSVLAMISPHNPEAMNRQVEECREHAIRLAYDPGQQVSNPATDLKAGVNAAEIVFVNDYELGVLTEKVGVTSVVLEKQVPILVTTLGKAGSAISGTKVGKPITIGIAMPDKVVDPTGAGDAYRAGFLYGYLRQWDLRLCGQLGAVVASFVVEQHGTQRLIDLKAVKERYHKTFKQELEI